MTKITVQPPQIDTELFQPGRKWADLVVAVGRLSPEKNFGALIQAVAALDWPRLVLIGDGPLYGELSVLANAVPDERAILLGAVPNAVVARWLAWAEYFVCPSLYEQAPKVVWEAMACGCSCIVSAQIGVVDDGVTGYRAEPTAKGLQHALERAKYHVTKFSVRSEARAWVLRLMAGDSRQDSFKQADQYVFPSEMAT